MRVNEIEYYVDGIFVESYSGDDIHIPNVGFSVALRKDQRPREVLRVFFDCANQCVEVTLSGGL